MLRATLVVIALLVSAGCDREAPLREPSMAVEANYRLLYNGTLVGDALFVVDVDADGRYRFDAFTVPAGQMRRAATHEVLETSRGRLEDAAIRPSRFEQSVLHGEALEQASLAFDWERGRLAVAGPEGSREIVLLPGTHDRLSYLLAARRLAAAGEGDVLLRVASPEASEETRLVVAGREAVEVPAGSFDAVVLRRSTADEDETRRLWFVPRYSPLPLRVLQERDGNTVDMQLATLSRRSNDPR